MDEKKSEFKPYIPAEKAIPEFTIAAVICGIILAVVFGAANAYLGLKVGQTVSASIPAAVISMGIFRALLKRNSILENNMVQTIGSAGESIASGAIFTLPVMFMWSKEGLCEPPEMLTICLLALCGGMLGVVLMVPLRNALIVEEHGVLLYPEGVACAEVLKAGEKSGSKAKVVFAGLGIAGAFKFVADGIKVFTSSIQWDFSKYKGAGIGLEAMPALLGIGFICKLKVAARIFAGGVLSWLVIMPLIVFFGGDTTVFPSVDATIGEMFASGGTSAIWSSYIRYIGAGALVTAGLISLVKSIPTIAKTFSAATKSYGKGKSISLKRTDENISMKLILIVVVAAILFLWLCPVIPINLPGALLAIVFSFFFATVAARLVGDIGSSNNPASGMTIATLLIVTIIMKATGMAEMDGMVMAIAIGTIVTTVVCISADTSQDLKTGYILGATPKKQQYGEMIGAAATALAVGAIVYLFDAAWGYGSEELAAPQATMMKMITEGIMKGNLPWTLIFIGAGAAVIVELLHIPALTFAIGMYLPIGTTATIFIGSIIRWFVDKKKYASDEEREESAQRGVLYSSGLIAGEGIIGILLALFAVIKIGDKSIGSIIDVSSVFSLGTVGGIIMIMLLAASIYFVCVKKKKAEQ